MTVLTFRMPDPLGVKGQCLEFSAPITEGLIRIYGRWHLHFITFSRYRRFLLPGTRNWAYHACLDSDPAAQEVPPMRVLDLLQSRKDIFSIQEETTVHDAARYLRDHNVRSVGVLDGSARLVGVVSQSDISDKVAAENKCPAWMRVSEIMTRDLVVVQPEAPLDECLRLMEKHGVFHLLVTEESGRFLGMISVADL